MKYESWESYFVNACPNGNGLGEWKTLIFVYLLKNKFKIKRL